MPRERGGSLQRSVRPRLAHDHPLHLHPTTGGGHQREGRIGDSITLKILRERTAWLRARPLARGERAWRRLPAPAPERSLTQSEWCHDLEMECVVRASQCARTLTSSVSDRHLVGTMRTILNMDDDLLAAAKSAARPRAVSVGTLISKLARKGMKATVRTRKKNRFPVFSILEDSPPITREHAKRIEDHG